MRENQLFKELHKVIPKQKSREARKNTWTLEDTLRLVDTIVFVRQDPTRNNQLLCCLGRQIKASLKADPWHHVEMSGGAIETLLASNALLVKDT